MQGLQDLFEEYEPHGFVVISVIVQDQTGDLPATDDAALWQDELELTFPVVADVEGTFWPVWDPDGILPVTSIVDPDGIIVRHEPGGGADIDAIERSVLEHLP